MSPTSRRFRRLLTVELESLREELEILVEYQDRRLANHEITDYVRNSNVSTLQNEIMGLQDFLREECCLELDEDSDVSEMAEAVRSALRRYAITHDLVPALFEVVSLRIGKIVGYLKAEEIQPVAKHL
jgi:hypothetical protein